ncbi:hypothetical protein, partial [Xanthomonas hortorum]|uniref:hypothetical protein n=1 Tax=Xanthomonas hortorum TaxID=56454 RepID=UPI0020447093
FLKKKNKKRDARSSLVGSVMFIRDRALSITLHRARGRSYVVSAAIALVHDLRRSSRRGRNQHSTRM